MKIQILLLILFPFAFQSEGQNDPLWIQLSKNDPVNNFQNDSINDSQIEDSLPTNIIEKIKKHTTQNILNCFLMGESHGDSWTKKIIYIVTFTDLCTRIYNSETDSLSEEVYNSFDYTWQSYLASTKSNWEIFRDGTEFNDTTWQPKAIINKSQFDSIKCIVWRHYIGYKDGIARLFYFKKDSDSLIGFNTIKSSSKIFPVQYPYGLFIKLSSPDKNINGKISYIDYETGLPKSKFMPDSIINFPTGFVNFALVRKGTRYLIYSYFEDKIIDSSFTKYYIAPDYDIPIILKKGYVATGAFKRWQKFNIKNAISIDFEINGDLVTAHINTKDGKKYDIDLWKEVMTTGND